jgi:poly(3-hydroxybutyrate) depolymerase
VLYPWLDWQRAGLETWLSATRVAGLAAPLEQALHPPRELLARTLAAGAVSGRPIEDVVRRNAPFPIEAEAVAATPFVRFVRLRRPSPTRRWFVLLAPHSGYAVAVISPLATVLLAMGEVIVTDWIDGRLIPESAGAFGLAEQVAVGLEAADHAGARAHLVALSQSGPATLAAAALLASHSVELAPLSLTFLGCQLDPRGAPTSLQQALGQWPRDLLAASLTTAVAAGYPGVGRRVYPSLYQLLAYSMASPGLYAEVQQGLLRELAAGRAGDFDRQHVDLHSLLDVPGELFVQMLDWVLDRSPWDGDAPILADTRYDLTPLNETPVLTLEAGQDELVGRGQTHALATRLKSSRPVTLPDGRHHDLFTGPRFVAGVAPLLRQFYAEVGR